jgi:hypothetical protein
MKSKQRKNTMYNEQELDKTMADWLRTKRCSDDDATNAKILARVISYLEDHSYVAISHFERAYLELVASGDVKPFRGALEHKPSPYAAIPAEVVAFIENPRTSAFEISRRYANDRAFQKQYDQYGQLKLKEKVAQDTQQLTPETFHSMSAQEARTKYHRDPKFRVQVDQLSAAGKI